MQPVRILIVEDDAIIAHDVMLMLQQLGYEVAGVAHTAAQAQHLIAQQAPDLAILDINLGTGPSGIELAGWIRSRYRFPYLFLTSYSDRETLQQAREAHPVSYVVKPFEDHDLLAAIEIGLVNHARRDLPGNLDLARLNQQLRSPLTEREFEMLLEVLDGKTNQQIAESHFVSLNTVKTHIKHLFDKLEVHSRPEAIVRIRQWFS